jgi:glycosyltransferase involved in cell wall biosynthesis
MTVAAAEERIPTASFGAEVAQQLHAFGALYETLCSLARPRSGVKPELLLQGVARAAQFAQEFHPGRFADGRLDNVVLALGADLERLTPPPAIDAPVAPRGRCRILHVSTAVFGVGGHTRTLKNWVETEPESVHWLFLTEQAGRPVPDWLQQAFGRGGAVIVAPDGLGRLQRARLLREVAHSFADLVVLHQFGSDTVPGLAFAVDGPPVAVLNHADDRFWLGSSVTDFIIHQRQAGDLPFERRFVPRSAVLPIPLAPRPRVGRREARRALGLPDAALVLLTVGRAEKFLPTARHDFLRTAARLLERIPAAHLYLVGIDAEQLARLPGPGLHPRLHACGSLEDPWMFQQAADVFLEPFPFGSATAVLEAALAGTAVVLMYDPLLDLVVTNHGLTHLIPNPVGEDAYVERVAALASSPESRERLADALVEHVLARHTGAGWRAQAERVCEEVRACRHQPRAIPETRCESTHADLALAYWHSFIRSASDPRAEVMEALLSFAHQAGREHAYGACLGMLAQAVRRMGWDPRFALRALKLPLDVLRG